MLLLTLALLIDPCRAGADAVAQKDYPQAEPLLKTCVRSADAPLEAFLLLCGVFQARGDSDALARTALDGIGRFPQEKRFYLTAGTLAGRQKRFAQAIDILGRAHARWPEDEKVRSLLASSQFRLGTDLLDAGDHPGAAEALKRAVELAPGDVEAQLNLGRALHNLQQYTEALAAFEAVAKLQPSFPLLHFHRGATYYAAGQFEHAIEETTQEIESNPDYPPAYLVRGRARLSNGYSDAALADLRTAATRMVSDAGAQFWYGRALLQAGKLDDAEARFRSSMSLDPADPGAVNALIGVLVRTNRLEEAQALRGTAAELSRRQRTAKPGEIRYQSTRPAPR
jgi:tetratricopeptide (TPR) repeat protein